jgi:hypothetical protein
MAVDIVCGVVAVVNITIRYSVTPGKAEDDHNENYYSHHFAYPNSVTPGKAEDDHAEDF